MIGRNPTVQDLVLIPREDFDYALRNKDGSAFESGLTFQLVIGTTSRTFGFNSGRTIASLRIESTDISDDLHQQPFWITSTSTTTTPTTDKVLTQGTVSIFSCGIW